MHDQALALQQAAALAEELTAAKCWPEIESLARKWLTRLPPVEPGSARHSVQCQFTEKLLEALFQQGRTEESFVGFLELVRLTAADVPTPFVELYVQAMKQTRMKPVPLGRLYRGYRLSSLLEQTLALEGETAECGCYRGLSSYVACATERRRRPGYDGYTHHVFDSFEGLSAPQAEDVLDPENPDAARLATMSEPGAFRASLDEVQQNLSDFPCIDYHPGWIPRSLPAIAEWRYRFVHLDLDLYAPTIGALEYFWPRLVPNGNLLCDDYGWPGGRRAMDEFSERHHIGLEKNEFNQAWLRKPV